MATPIGRPPLPVTAVIESASDLWVEVDEAFGRHVARLHLAARSTRLEGIDDVLVGLLAHQDCIRLECRRIAGRADGLAVCADGKTGAPHGHAA
ncbi:MAG: hypothetical protein V1912_11265 [bacterium]